jgi:hypothetical protein
LTTVPLSLFLASLGVIVILDILLIADIWAKPKTRINSTYVPMLPASRHFKFDDFVCRCEGDRVILCKAIEVEKVLLQITLPKDMSREAMDRGITVVLQHTEDMLRSLEMV